MLFSSFEFLIFMSLVLALYACLPHRAQNRMLLVASYIFYATWDWRFLGLILFSTVTAYFIGRQLERDDDPARRRFLIITSVVVNLAILGFFKYMNFFASSLTTMLAALGVEADYATLNIVLPVGISFYTFQVMSYTIDAYRRKAPRVDAFLDFALFVAFFPQLLAGPIARASSLMPQITQPRQLTYDSLSRGAFLILFGLFKKIVVADGVSRTVDVLYSTTGYVSWGDLVLGTALFAVQIYCDFSGYSDMACGVAKLLGFDLTTNFNVPYAATNPQEFWRRWHISLSTWLRDYLYIPLGGSRNGKAATYRNLLVTMILGGLWHGAAWNFALWGAYQGLLLGVHRALFGASTAEASAPRSAVGLVGRVIKTACFFAVTCYGWLLFRAESLQQIVHFTRILLFDFGDFSRNIPAPTFAALPGIALLFLIDLAQYLDGRAEFYRRWPEPLRGALYASILFLLAMGLGNQPTQFIYARF